MNRHKWLVAGVILGAMILALLAPVSGGVHAQTPMARVRFLHALPGTTPMNVYMDGVLAVSHLAYGEATPHLNVEGGEHLVTLKAAGAAADAPALLEVSVPLVPSLAFTVVVQGRADAPEAVLYEDILDEIAPGFARVMAINAIAGSPALDILDAQGGPLVQGVSYGVQFGTININTRIQDVVFVPAGGTEPLAQLSAVPLRSGVLYTFVAMGTLDGAVPPSVLKLETPVNGAAESVQVQFANGSADVDAVDVYMDDTLIAPGLRAGDLTGHVALPAGDHTLALRRVGAAADEPLLTADVSLAPDEPAVTVALLGEENNGTLSVQTFPDALADVPPDQARVHVINAVPGATVSVQMADGTVLAAAQADVAGAPMDIAPGSYMVLVNVQGEDAPIDLAVPEKSFVGGVYYTVMVFGGGALQAPVDARVMGTAVDVGVGSLPTMGGTAMAAAPAAPAAEETLPGEEAAQPAPQVATEEPQPMEAQPTQAAPAPAETELVVEATADTELVAQPPQETPPPAQPTPPPLQQQYPIGYVELNPGANLHCRELPGADKRSLGLIPAGSAVTVLGRTGTPLVPETGEATPEPTPTVTAVEELWLAVRWEPPGGGYVDCWVAAEFLRVEYRGRLLDKLDELWTLPEVPFNKPGEVVGADIQPPTPLFNAVVATVDLNPGVSLQLRRYPQADSESLDLVPARAQLEVLGYTEAPGQGRVGEPASPYWLYVRYRTENGGATVGWVSAQYVTLSKLGHPVEIADLPLVDRGEAGYYEAPGESMIPPEQQDVVGVVNLNPGANLNLRDRPSADARVVLGIPSGDHMVLDGRNGDGTWVHVKYEDAIAGEVEGWVAAQYLNITRAGQPYDIKGLPIVTGEADTMGG